MLWTGDPTAKQSINSFLECDLNLLRTRTEHIERDYHKCCCGTSLQVWAILVSQEVRDV